MSFNVKPIDNYLIMGLKKDSFFCYIEFYDPCRSIKTIGNGFTGRNLIHENISLSIDYR